MAHPPELIDHVKALHMPAVGITDHGNMHGAYEMWSTAVKAGVKPIIGIEAYVTPETARGDKTHVHWGTPEQRCDDVSSNVEGKGDSSLGPANRWVLRNISLSAVKSAYRTTSVSLESSMP